MDDLYDVWRDDQLIEALAHGDELDGDDPVVAPLRALARVSSRSSLPELPDAILAEYGFLDPDLAEYDLAAGGGLAEVHPLDGDRNRRYAVRSLAAAVTVIATLSTSGVAAVVTGDPFRPAKAVWHQIQVHTVKQDADDESVDSSNSVVAPVRPARPQAHEARSPQRTKAHRPTAKPAEARQTATGPATSPSPSIATSPSPAGTSPSTSPSPSASEQSAPGRGESSSESSRPSESDSAQPSPEGGSQSQQDPTPSPEPSEPTGDDALGVPMVLPPTAVSTGPVVGETPGASTPELTEPEGSADDTADADGTSTDSTSDTDGTSTPSSLRSSSPR